jgi:hypothetical protein
MHCLRMATRGPETSLQPTADRALKRRIHLAAWLGARLVVLVRD